MQLVGVSYAALDALESALAGLVSSLRTEATRAKPKVGFSGWDAPRLGNDRSFIWLAGTADDNERAWQSAHEMLRAMASYHEATHDKVREAKLRYRRMDKEIGNEVAGGGRTG